MNQPLSACASPSSSSQGGLTRSLPTPAELARQNALPASAELYLREVRGRLRHRLLEGSGPLIAVVGPCSIHSEEAARAYAERLEPLVRRLEEDVLVVMRAYFEKPRTTVGWKGFLYDPDLDGQDDLKAGLTRAHALLAELSRARIPLATEILDPLVCEYFESQLSWVAIGARTAESQIHRQTASRLACPVGIKNGTDGSVEVAISAMLSAAEPHTHLGIDENGRVGVKRSAGNPTTHVVLRGGKSGPNYDAVSIGEVGLALTERGMRPAVLVDCSHGNSEKDYRRQPAVARAVLEQLERPDVDILGVMIESHLAPGKQAATPSARHDQSVTDACIDFAETERLLEELALAARRKMKRS